MNVDRFWVVCVGFWGENGRNGGVDGEGKLWRERAGSGVGLGGQMDGGHGMPEWPDGESGHVGDEGRVQAEGTEDGIADIKHWDWLTLPLCFWQERAFAGTEGHMTAT